MKKLLLSLVGVIGFMQLALATTCPSATVIPASPTLPYTQSVTCGSTDDINSGNATVCGSGLYLGGQEAVYTWTPSASYTSVTIDYSGQSWTGIFLYAGCPTSGGTCIGNITSSATAKTLNVASITAGTTYYIVFDTWPSPPSPCPGTFTINGSIVAPAAPPAPVQAGGTPTCTGGTTLSITGTPPANVTWYWQTTATGTSTAIPYSGPYTVYANGTYYARSYDASISQWSTTSSSVVVSNFPTSTAPPAPVAAQNPSCAPTGTTLTVAAAPAGYTYYWQGMVNGGSSNAQNAASPYSATATGTYYVAAYETASGCWSNTTGIAITVDSYIPATPTLPVTFVNACLNESSILLNANAAQAPMTTTITIASNYSINGGASGTLNGNVSLPAGATITSSVLSFNGVTTASGSWPSDVSINMTGAATLGATVVAPVNMSVTNAGPYTQNPTVSGNGAFALNLTHNYSFGGPASFSSITLTVNYTMPITVTWANAASGGTILGTGTPFQAVGTSVLPNTNTGGSYVFHAGSMLGGCPSASTVPMTVNITPVLATLVPVDASCNGNNNGSFTLGTVQCGNQPFTYSVNAGPFGPIPTNLTAGTYSVVIKDALLNNSAPITVVVNEPSAPQNLQTIDANYFNGVITWTPQGNETSWTVEVGPAGFTPGTGTVINATNDTITVDGLDPDTDYEFYVTANCGTNSDMAGPASLNTNAGFYTFDNSCGPGFTDISATGTALNLADDASTTVTPGFPVSFQGTTATTVTVSNNGWIQFGGVTLNAWNLDLDDEYGNVYHQTVTIGGEQYFIVQWNDRPRFSSIAGQTVTFQLLMRESTGEVYYIYNDVVFGGSQSSNDYGGQGTISATGPMANITVSSYSTAYLTDNSCVHFYAALCPNPTNLTVQAFQEEAIIDWNAGLYGETNWTIIYGPTGFDPATGGTTITSTNSDANIFGLTQNTTYDVYVYAECAADDLTSGGLLNTFTTLPFCTAPSNITTTTNVDLLSAAWNWTENAGYPIDHFELQYGMAGFTPYGAGAHPYSGTGTDFTDSITDPDFMGGGVYEVYVQAVCATSDTSLFVGPISFIMPLTNDFTCDAEMLAVDGTQYTFNNTGASGTETAIAPPATGAQTTTGWTNSTLNNSTWFTFVAPASGQVRVNNTAINYNGQVAVYEVGDCLDYATFTLEAANDNEIGGTSLAPNFTICGLTPGATYYLMHDGFNGTTGNYSIMITPIVLEAGTAQPLTAICTGSSIDLFTTVSGNNTGGVWSSSIPAVNVSINGSDFASAGLAYQVFDMQYRVTDGCAFDSIVTQVQVYPPSSAGEDGVINACRNEHIDLLAGLSGNADLEGTWYNPQNAALPNSQVVTGNVPGQFNYDYIAGNGVCPNDTANVLVMVGTCDELGIDEEVFSGVSIYPNPSKGLIYVANESASEAFDYTITDANGRVIKAAQQGIGGAATTAINLGEVQTGIYFIRLANAQAEKVFRVVIN